MGGGGVRRKRTALAQLRRKDRALHQQIDKNIKRLGSTGTFVERSVGFVCRFIVRMWEQFRFVLFKDLFYRVFKKNPLWLKLYCISFHSKHYIHLNRSRNLRHLCWSALNLDVSICQTFFLIIWLWMNPLQHNGSQGLDSPLVSHQLTPLF